MSQATGRRDPLGSDPTELRWRWPPVLAVLGLHLVAVGLLWQGGPLTMDRPAPPSIEVRWLSHPSAADDLGPPTGPAGPSPLPRIAVGAATSTPSAPTPNVLTASPPSTPDMAPAPVKTAIEETHAGAKAPPARTAPSDPLATETPAKRVEETPVSVRPTVAAAEPPVPPAQEAGRTPAMEPAPSPPVTRIPLASAPVSEPPAPAADVPLTPTPAPRTMAAAASSPAPVLATARATAAAPDDRKPNTGAAAVAPDGAPSTVAAVALPVRPPAAPGPTSPMATPSPSPTLQATPAAAVVPPVAPPPARPSVAAQAAPPAPSSRTEGPRRSPAVDAQGCKPSERDYWATVGDVEVTGTTRLRFSLDANGRVVKTEILQSAGASRAHRALDRLAERTLRECRSFEAPGTESGRLLAVDGVVVEYVWTIR